jgi:hypothetical protein
VSARRALLAAAGVAVCAWGLACGSHDAHHGAKGSASAGSGAASASASAGAGSAGSSAAEAHEVEGHAVPLVVTPACRAAIAQLGHTAPDARVGALLGACEPCGPWAPLIHWRTRQPDGGPPRAAIADTMIACGAYCDPNAKERFLGTLDDARGKSSRGPWRQLADVCKAAVSAAPDARFASATMFALDRIGRAVGSDAGSAAAAELAALATVELPLPALSISGVGIELPRSPAADPTAPRRQLTVTAGEVRTGELPIGRLGGSGVAIDLGSDAYPGALAGSGTWTAQADASLATALHGSDAVTVLAPAKMSAKRVAEVVEHAAVARVLLAAGIDAPDTWQLVGTVPVSLRDPRVHAGKTGEHGQIVPLVGPPGDVTADPAQPVVVVAGSGATVQDLSDLLTKLHALGVKQVALRAGLQAGP